MTDHPENKFSTVEVSGLKKAYGKKLVVKGVDFSLTSGEVVGLLGPNGAGKTTSFYMIVGLIRPTEGSILFDQKDITKVPMFRRARMGLGYLPQEPSVFRKLTVSQNLEAILQTRRLKGSERKDLLNHYLDELGLERVANQKAFTLSGGERRRLEITRALITQPKFLLMDEPFSGVDPISVADVQSIILKLKDKGIGVLITDHNVRETLKIVDRAYLLHDGKILAQGNSEELINNPESRKFYLGQDFNL